MVTLVQVMKLRSEDTAMLMDMICFLLLLKARLHWIIRIEEPKQIIIVVANVVAKHFRTNSQDFLQITHVAMEKDLCESQATAKKLYSI